MTDTRDMTYLMTRTLRLTLRIIVFLPGITLQLIGMVFTLVGWTLLTIGFTLRMIGAILTGFLVVTRGLYRFVAARHA